MKKTEDPWGLIRLRGYLDREEWAKADRFVRGLAQNISFRSFLAGMKRQQQALLKRAKKKERG